MKILAIEIEKPGLTAGDFAPYLEAEAKQAYDLYLAGVFRELYFRQDEHSAVIMLECAGMEEARQALDSLPLAKAGLIHFEILPLEPYPGFSRLFAE
jgi:hypothetical protein